MRNLHFGHAVFVVMVSLGLWMPEQIELAVSEATSWFVNNFGWTVLLVSAVFVCLCIYLAFSRYGDLRLGGQDEVPRFSTLSWLAMLFAAGMGAGLVFYGAAEPLMHFMSPPPSAQLIAEGAGEARRAMAITYFHWGIHAWAIYAVAALSVAYFTFHRHTPMLPSAPIATNPVLAQAIDGLAVIAVVFGIVATLSQSMLLISDGVANHFSLQESKESLKFIILGVLFVCYMLSASTGIGKGIKILSDINLVLAIALVVFILFAGPTHFIIESFTTGIGDYLDRFVQLSFNARPFSDAGGWTESWTITYFLWWVSWGPFVGVFIARISRGRTIREFMLGVIFVPTLFSALWFATLGGTAIHLEMYDQPGFGEVTSNLQGVTYALLQTLPLPEITGIIMLLLIFIFLVTSADSGTYVLGMFTQRGELRPSVKQRLFWGVMIGVITLSALLTDASSTAFFRAVAVAGGMPYLIIMVWQIVALIRAMRRDAKQIRR